MEDHYKTLGVSRDASLETIKERYRFLAHAYHPDKFTSETHKSQAEQEFKKLSQAFKTLSKAMTSAFGCELDDGTSVGQHHAHEKSSSNHKHNSRPRSGKSKAVSSTNGSHYRFISFLKQLHQRKAVFASIIAVLLISPAIYALKNTVQAKRPVVIPIETPSTTQRVDIPSGESELKPQMIAAEPIVMKWSDEGVMSDPEFVKASVELVNSNFAESFNHFNAVSQRFPMSQLALIKVSGVICEMFSADHSITTPAQAVVDNPISADAWLCLADALNAKEHFSEALYAYHKAVELEPKFEIGWNALGAILDGNGQTQEAVDAYRHAVQINPRRPQNWNSLALALQKQGKIPEAITVFKQAVDEKSANANTWNNLGVALMSQAKTEEALDAFRRSVALEPSLAKAWNNLGVGLQVAGKKDEAQVAFVQAHQVSKD